MRVKLLKKVRKRYVIRYFPKQFRIGEDIFAGQCMVLTDNENQYAIYGVEICEFENYQRFCNQSATTKEQAKGILLDKLAEWIAKDYKRTRTRKTKQVVEIVWYNRK